MIRRTTTAFLLLAATAFAAAPAATPPKPDPNHKPTIWLIGDSTVRNGSFDNGATAGQWGWGHLLHYYFDTSKVNVVNDAMGGTSSKSFQENPNLWPLVIAKVQPGDYVLMQFGHNDAGTPKGNGDETTPATGRGAQPGAVNHTFGWYMRQYIEQVKAKGATPIVCSLIPRNNWSPDGKKINRGDTSFGLWAKQAAEQEHVPFLPLNTIIADKYDQLGKQKVTADLFPPGEGTHPNWAGAKLNAECVVEGLKQIDSPLKAFLLPDPKVPDKADITPSTYGELGPDETGAMKKWESQAARRAAATSQPGQP
jgi:lysophospholipase L1-like esterase